MSYVKAKEYGPDGCQVPEGKGKCGETKTLGILDEFKTLYETRMRQLDAEIRAGGDCLQAKLTLQEQWIKDLMEQNEMMARTVEQLEVEATERVQMLEEKLQSSAKCICEQEELIEEKEKRISILSKDTERISIFGDPERLSDQLKKKDNDFKDLKQSMLDMRKALTEEVASKHDVICALRRDIQQLEEQCVQADKQIAFKEDIIKELRKELRQLKQQTLCSEKVLKWCADNEKIDMAISPRLMPGEHSNIHRKAEEGPFITINHLKAEHPANSTVIFIHKHNRSKKCKTTENKEQDDHSPMPCTGCNRRFPSDSIVLNKKYEDTIENNENLMNKDTKSHNCIDQFRLKQTNMRPVKENSRYTMNVLEKCDLFLNSISGGDSSQRQVDIPNHIPVKTYVKNIEYINTDNENSANVLDKVELS